MNIVVVAATDFELSPLRSKVSTSSLTHNIRFHTTGVGIMESTYHITKLLDLHSPDLALQIGIAGTFDSQLRNGSVVWIESDTVADQGVWENNAFKSLSDLNLLAANQTPYVNGLLPNPIQHPFLNTLQKGPAITVNQISTDPKYIQTWNQLYHPIVESMEGAPFHFACLKKSIPFLQIRAVSNQVGDRNKANWDFKSSLENLCSVSYKFIESL